MASFGQTLPEQVSLSAQIHQLPVVLLSIPWMSVDVVNIKDLSNVKTCGATFSHKAPRKFHIAEALACMLKLGFICTTEDDHWEPILVSRKWSPAGTTDQVLSFTSEDGRRALVEADWALKLSTSLTLRDLILELPEFGSVVARILWQNLDLLLQLLHSFFSLPDLFILLC